MRYAVVIGVLLISIPLLLRVQSPEPYPDAESYTQLASSSAGSEHTLTDYLYHAVPGQIILIVCAALSLFLISLSYDDEIFLVLLAASPAFIKAFTTAGPAAIGFVIISLSVLLAHKKKYWSVLSIPLCFSLSFSLGVLATVTLIVIALVRDTPFIALGASFFALVSATITSVIAHNLDIGFTSTAWNDYIGIIGGGTGVTVFLVFLGLLGFLLKWAEERKASHIIALLLVPTSMFFHHGLIILAAFLAFYGSKALRFLSEREWHFEELRNITLLLIACGILFSLVIEEKERIALNEERINVVTFVTAAYPQGIRIAAPPEVTPILQYKGFAADAIPENSDTSILRYLEYRIVVTASDDTRFQDVSATYSAGYSVHELSSEQ